MNGSSTHEEVDSFIDKHHLMERLPSIELQHAEETIAKVKRIPSEEPVSYPTGDALAREWIKIKLRNNYCANCLKAGCTAMCRRCHLVYYCCRECQVEHWTSHHRGLCCKEEGNHCQPSGFTILNIRVGSYYNCGCVGYSLEAVRKRRASEEV